MQDIKLILSAPGGSQKKVISQDRNSAFGPHRSITFTLVCWCTPVACTPSHHLASPARASVVRSASQWCTAGWPRSFPAPTSTASPATAPPLLAAPPARPADRAQLHAGSAGEMVPSREGERPCRRLALLQPEAQLPVTRVGEQGAPPRRVGRLLSGCGARPPPQSPVRQVPPGQGGRAHPLAPLKVRAFHAGGLGSGPGPGPPPPKKSSLSPPHSFGCSLSEPPRVGQPMRADTKERDRLRQQVDRVCRNCCDPPPPLARCSRYWPSAV